LERQKATLAKTGHSHGEEVGDNADQGLQPLAALTYRLRLGEFSKPEGKTNRTVAWSPHFDGSVLVRQRSVRLGSGFLGDAFVGGRADYGQGTAHVQLIVR
jgi:hypothetical protein